MKSQPSSFSASRAKLRRAAGFIRELESNLKAYKDRNPYTVKIDATISPPGLEISWAAICGDPEAIVGDCIHNLRTSLDLMACELVRSVNGNDNRVYFPFAHTSDELDDAIKEKNFHRAGRGAVDLLKTFKPYRGGNELLRAMHDLDIEDKHKALIVTATTTKLLVQGRYEVGDIESGNFSVTAENISYTFPEDSILPGRDIIQTLKDLMELVNGILEAFSNLIDPEAVQP